MRLVQFVLTVCLCFNLNAQIDSNKGHPQHIIAGIAIGGVTSYLVFKKTNNKVKAWFFGVGTATILGLAKEVIDPLIGSERSSKDFAYTVAGGVIGASIVIPLKKTKSKKVTYLY